MRVDRDQPHSDRQRTDDSLRLERERADQALKERLLVIDDVADRVISLARTRADAVLALSRSMADSALPPVHSAPPTRIARERRLADHVVRAERIKADETVRDERVEHVESLLGDRDETNNDLLSERAHSDDVLATRDAFLNVVSHDLRNMLMAITGFASLIAAEVTGENAQVRMDAQCIEQAGARMNRLIGDLIDVASIEAGVFTVVRELGDPTHVVTEAVDMFRAQAAEAGISMVTDIASPTPLAAFDAGRILQVVTNLLSNAIKFTPRNGAVVVHVGPVGNDIHFAVRDTGIGIATANLEAVFARFHQVTENDRRGVGLGLYISKSIVDAHGGRIWIESRIDEGSTFCFTLPIDRRPTG